MPRAEVGSVKHLSNQMKLNGLQKLRFWCEPCHRQMRDQNGFAQHCRSESHVRQMQLISEDPRKAINDFSNQFLKDFIQLLRTGHGEKKVNVNHFYQEYISNKQHIHMTATKWSSLTEFAKYLGREGICRVDEDEKNEGRAGASGLTISWIDKSPEKLRRQEALQKKERENHNDEQLEQKMIREQIRRAKRDMADAGLEEDEEDLDTGLSSSSEGIKRKDGEKIVLNFGVKKLAPDAAEKPLTPPVTEGNASSPEVEKATESGLKSTTASSHPAMDNQPVTSAPLLSLSSLTSSKPKNVFATASKKNALSGSKKASSTTTQRPMSEVERIMREGQERERQREAGKFQGGRNVFKKQRVS